MACPDGRVHGLRCCHWLLAVSHHCLGLIPTLGMPESYQFLLWIFSRKMLLLVNYFQNCQACFGLSGSKWVKCVPLSLRMEGSLDMLGIPLSMVHEPTAQFSQNHRGDWWFLHVRNFSWLSSIVCQGLPRHMLLLHVPLSTLKQTQPVRDYFRDTGHDDWTRTVRLSEGHTPRGFLPCL